jgi:hypothetical protein
MSTVKRKSLGVVAATMTIWASAQSPSAQNILGNPIGQTPGASNPSSSKGAGAAEADRKAAASMPTDTERSAPFPIINATGNPYTGSSRSGNGTSSPPK